MDMYPNRPPVIYLFFTNYLSTLLSCFIYNYLCFQVPSGPGQPYKFTVLETCDRIKDEFNFVQQQCHQYVLLLH